MAGRCVTRGTDAALVYYSAISSGKTEREREREERKAFRTGGATRRRVEHTYYGSRNIERLSNAINNSTTRFETSVFSLFSFFFANFTFFFSHASSSFFLNFTFLTMTSPPATFQKETLQLERTDN